MQVHENLLKKKSEKKLNIKLLNKFLHSYEMCLLEALSHPFKIALSCKQDFRFKVFPFTSSKECFKICLDIFRNIKFIMLSGSQPVVIR